MMVKPRHWRHSSNSWQLLATPQQQRQVGGPSILLNCQRLTSAMSGLLIVQEQHLVTKHPDTQSVQCTGTRAEQSSHSHSPSQPQRRLRVHPHSVNFCPYTRLSNAHWRGEPRDAYQHTIIYTLHVAQMPTVASLLYYCQNQSAQT